MKKILPILLICSTLLACNHKQQATEEPVSRADSAMISVLQAIFDSTRTIFEVKDELNLLLDTMQFHVLYHPDDDVRIGAKSMGLTLTGLLMSDYCSPDEEKFFIDSLLLRFVDVKDSWYLDMPHPDSVNQLPILNQYVLRQDDETNNHITEIDVYLTPDGNNKVIIFFPKDAASWPMVTFSDEDLQMTRISYHEEDALAFYERTEQDNMAIVFDQKLIDEMLTHKGMFIGYINDNTETEKIEERFCDCMLLLDQFQKQYNDFYNK